MLVDDRQQTRPVLFRLGRANAVRQLQFFAVGRLQKSDVAQGPVAGDAVGGNPFRPGQLQAVTAQGFEERLGLLVEGILWRMGKADWRWRGAP